MKKGKHILKIVFLAIVVGFSFLFFSPIVLAQVNEVNYENLMINLIEPTPIIRGELIKIIFTVIQYLLSFLGVVAILILIYGGFLWMTARGDEERVRKAKKVLINGLIGLIIILLSYAIVFFVGQTFLRLDVPGEGPPNGGGPGGLPTGAKYLVITSKYPKDGETTARNTRIIITFNQNLDPTSVKLARPNSPTTCKDDQGREIWTVGIQNNRNQFIDGSLKVIGNSLIFTPKGECPAPLNQFQCEIGENGPCFLNFKKEGCCGCFEEGRDYKITLISRRKFGNQTLIGLKGLRAFGNTMYRDEIWKFNVGPYVDSRAPAVENNLPQGNKVARNIGILITFDKEIDLTTLKLYNPNCVSGSANCNKDNCNTANDICLDYAVDTLDKATVKIYKIEGTEMVGIPGFFERFSTKSFLFRPSAYCPKPAQMCRCLPELTEINIELDNNKIRGANCIALDCTNGKCAWKFKTSDQIDITPPTVKSTDPENNAEDQDRLLKIKVVFDDDSGMDATSVNEDTFVLRPFISPREIKTENNTSTLTPSKILEPDTRYSPIIYGGGQPGKNACNLDPDYAFGVKDLAGNAMVGNYTWNFKTGWLVNGGNPYIDWVDPRQGPRGDCVTVHGYNLGCCAPYDCNDDLEAQKKEIKLTKIGTKIKVECATAVDPGKALMLKQVSPPAYASSKVLRWEEINKPAECGGPPPNPSCPTTCALGGEWGDCPSASCSKCKLCSGSQAECQTEKCWCRIRPYSPENELIIVVPDEAINRSPSDPGEIRVEVAQDRP